VTGLSLLDIVTDDDIRQFYNMIIFYEHFADRICRANVEADNISADGFDIKVRTRKWSIIIFIVNRITKITTWGDTKLWSITASWFAYEKTPASVQGTMLHSGRLAFNRKLKGYDLDEGSQERSIVQSVKYPVKFNTTPSVVLGFCLIDHLNDADWFVNENNDS